MTHLHFGSRFFVIPEVNSPLVNQQTPAIEKMSWLVKARFRKLPPRNAIEAAHNQRTLFHQVLNGLNVDANYNYAVEQNTGQSAFFAKVPDRFDRYFEAWTEQFKVKSFNLDKSVKPKKNYNFKSLEHIGKMLETVACICRRENKKQITNRRFSEMELNKIHYLLEHLFDVNRMDFFEKIEKVYKPKRDDVLQKIIGRGGELITMANAFNQLKKQSKQNRADLWVSAEGFYDRSSRNDRREIEKLVLYEESYNGLSNDLKGFLWLKGSLPKTGLWRSYSPKS